MAKVNNVFVFGHGEIGIQNKGANYSTIILSHLKTSQKIGKDFPLDSIDNDLRGVELVFDNLEGLIVFEKLLKRIKQQLSAGKLREKIPLMLQMGA